MKLPETFSKEHKKNINAIIETPKSSGNKYTFDPETSLFKLSKILPKGMIFPLHFGFIPGTKGQDGDPLDVLVLMDEPSYPGCWIECAIVGTIEAEQTEKGKTIRNDRIIARAIESRQYEDVDSLGDLDDYLLEEIIDFFKNYNAQAGKKFTVLKNVNRHKTIEVIKESMI